MGVNMEETFFRQGGARPHTANAFLHFLNEHFLDRVISNQYPE
jgi:hypothetical protein